MSVKVKICGITSVSDALAAEAAGADALGFMFYPPSPRFISNADAREIMRELPPFIARVGVFVDSTEEQVRQTIAETGIDTLQFHGNETPEFCRRFGLKTFKAFRVRDAESLRATDAFATEAWLLDSYVAGQLGGTGARFNWELATEAAQRHCVILAGGLTPENAAEAVRKVRPYGLDVSSGVESSPGRKDAAKVRGFIAAAKGA